ncbi:MAG TPA: hypothetical protein VMF29_04165 [Candidatus Edwardsbacteria bacterium]|nr:hypothetical protein [Candidatus Edwardsbacteria bacterium]
MSDAAQQRTYEWACPRCHGSNAIASEVQRSEVTCGWCGHVVDTQQCTVNEQDR